MKYLGSEPFSLPRPSKVMAGTCEKCVYGSGEHDPNCRVVRLAIINAWRDGSPQEDRILIPWVNDVRHYE